MAIDLSGGGAERLPGSRALVWCAEASWRVAGLELWRRAVYTAAWAGFADLLIVADGEADVIRRALAGDPRLGGTRAEVLRSSEGWVKRVTAAGGRWVVLPDRILRRSERPVSLARRDRASGRDCHLARRLRGDCSARAQALFEAFGNREFAYLFFALAVFGKLHWFVWGMAFGLWAFPVGLLGL